MDGTTGFTLNGGGRVYFATKPAEDFSDPDMYWQVTFAFLSLPIHCFLAT